MIESLNNIVNKLILPKYPWIDRYEWRVFSMDGYDYYSLWINPVEGFKDSVIFLDKYEVEVEDEMKSLFAMLNPEPNQKFNRVEITD